MARVITLAIGNNDRHAQAPPRPDQGLIVIDPHQPLLQRGAQLIGIGAVIEKRFEGGREALADLAVPIETLAVITAMDNGKITLEE